MVPAMPLIRKPAVQSPQRRRPTRADVLRALASGDADERWAAARAAAEVPGGSGRRWLPRFVPKAIRGCAKRCSRAWPASARRERRAMLPFLRSDDASLRTGRTGCLAHHESAAMRELLPRLLADRRCDVRVLSCELARSLPGAEATRCSATLLAREQDVNVCAAAIDVLAEVGGPRRCRRWPHARSDFATRRSWRLPSRSRPIGFSRSPPSRA